MWTHLLGFDLISFIFHTPQVKYIVMCAAAWMFCKVMRKLGFLYTPMVTVCISLKPARTLYKQTLTSTYQSICKQNYNLKVHLIWWRPNAVQGNTHATMAIQCIHGLNTQIK
jgi:hypothetical protein